jgi:hypothetical protein
MDVASSKVNSQRLPTEKIQAKETINARTQD